MYPLLSSLTQIRNVDFCEHWLPEVPFKGDRNDYVSVKEYLDENYQDALDRYHDSVMEELEDE